jgi:hypothetical protein
VLVALPRLRSKYKKVVNVVGPAALKPPGYTSKEVKENLEAVIEN